jgi:hypothetical protein
MAVGVVAALGILMGSAGRAQDSSVVQRSLDSLPECQHDMGSFIEEQPGDSLVNPGSGELSLPGPTTNVPEFHDCQKLLFAVRSRLVYGPLAAIFGAWDMGARWDSLVQRRRDVGTGRRIPVGTVAGTLAAESSAVDLPIPNITITVAQAASGSGWALVEIYSWGRYAPLGIARGFNCAYFFMAGGRPRAKMVNFGSKEQDCSIPINPNAVPGRELEVRITSAPEFQGAGAIGHYPAAARWDWDPMDSVHVFGVRCGAAWCEVGPDGFQPGAPPSVPAGDLPAPPAYPSWWRRVHQIKGWFDEQQLATPFDTNPARPAPVRGRAFPDPLLDGFTKDNFASQWKRAAWLWLDSPDVGYDEKLNVLPATGAAWTGLTTVDLCLGSYNECRHFSWWTALVRWLQGKEDPACESDPGVGGSDEEWWARITSPDSVRYYCVRRRDHSAHLSNIPATAATNVPAGYKIPLPGAVRRCAEGCCEVEGPGG